jgi:hypothetical protein
VVCSEKHWPLPAKSRFRCRPSGPGAVAHRLAGSAAASGDAELTNRVFFGRGTLGVSHLIRVLKLIVPASFDCDLTDETSHGVNLQFSLLIFVK